MMYPGFLYMNVLPQKAILCKKYRSCYEPWFLSRTVHRSLLVSGLSMTGGKDYH